MATRPAPPTTAYVLGMNPRMLARGRRSWSPKLAPHRTVNARIMWRIDRALMALRAAGRRSIAILDTSCGEGGLLIGVAERARRLGFTAIEAVGLDRSRAQVGRARAEADRHKDPAIGLRFAVLGAAKPIDAEDGSFDLTLAARDGGVGLSPEIARVSEGKVIRHD